jgi:hypothetical protein
MKFDRAWIAAAAIPLCSALPVAAQTTVTMEAESMALSSYAVENGNRIMLTSTRTSGTASKTFSGPSGTYNVQVSVVSETDGQPTVEVYKGATRLQTYKFPLGNQTNSFTISNVALNSGDSIRLVGRPDGGAVARLDKVVLTQIASSTTPAPTPTEPTPTEPSPTPITTTPITTTPTSTTLEAEAMSLSSYVVENGNRIRLTSSTGSGSASQNFSGASGTYNMQVHVVSETDGQSTVEVYKGATRLQTYRFPLGNASNSFTISNVALNAGETIRLVGRPDGGAVARLDKVVLTQVAASTEPPPATEPAPTEPTPTEPTPSEPTPTQPTPTEPTPTTPPILGDAVGSVSVTMEAESMALSSYATENGNRIRLTSSSGSGSASKAFSGASGIYNMHVYVVTEPDGRPTVEVHKGATRLRTYTYPLGNSNTSFTISSVALNAGEIIKLVGRPAGGALARIDKVVLTRGSATPTEPPPDSSAGNPPGSNLPSTNTRAVATFESLGLYWKPPSNPGAAGCTVQYRKSGESAWKQGLAMWYDARNGECRGSLVYLTPATNYQVAFGLPGQQPSAQLEAKTWSENFPIARVVHLPNGTSGETLNITQGGTASGYVLYTSPPGGQSTIDVANGRTNNITISAPYVIVRGVILKGAQADAIRLHNGAHDVVIEDNDISGWGRYRTTTADGQQVGMDMDAAVRAKNLTGLERVIVQRNKIHHPRYGANSWAYGHPLGPQGIGFNESAGGNHVFRYNEIYSAEGKYFNDGIGEGENFSSVGFPHADSDIYGNLIQHCWDDAIEAEGGNRNVRIWGNYMDRTMVAVATTATHVGPVYVFRNVHNRSRYSHLVSTDQDVAGPFSKSGTASTFGGGRRYLFHNTTLQARASGMTLPLGVANGIVGPNIGVTNTVSRNNIWHIKRSTSSSITQASSAGNDFDFDLFNGAIRAYSGAERDGIAGTPVYAAGHGWSSESNGQYQLAPGSAGHDRGARLPNFNDHFAGSAPDMGAGEAGRPAMRFGLKGAAPSSSTSDGAAASSAGDL